MKKLLSVLILALTAILPVIAEDADVHRFANYNIRYVNSSNGDTGQQLWANRKSYVIKLIKDYDFDIVGMEEVTGNNANPSQLQDLRNGLTDYADHSVEREGKNYSYNSIFYKKNKYTLLDKGHFYVNEHPQTPGIGWNTDIARTCIYVHLKDNSSGQDFYFCTTHVNYGAGDCGIQSGKLIGQRLKQIVGQTPVVLVGDFNLSRDNHETAYRGYASYFYDLALTTPLNQCLPADGPQVKFTTSGWTPAKDASSGNEFDYIFYDHMIPLSRHIITEYYPELGRTVNPSDHFPVLGRFRLGNQQHSTIFYANDANSLNKAMQDATMGDTICLTAGEYELTASLKPTCSLCIMGGFNADYSDVVGKSVLVADKLTEPMINIPKYYNLELFDIVMQGASVSTTDGGGAIMSKGQKLKLHNCVFNGNSATTLGGAVSAFVDTLLIDSCTFTHNTARTGGAVYAKNYQYVECIQSLFFGNEATDSGSAIAAMDFRNMNIQQSAFVENKSTKNGTLYIEPNSSTAVSANLLNNAFLNNTLESKKGIASVTKLYGGAAVYVRMNVATQTFNMAHCTLMGNKLTFNGAAGNYTGAAVNVFRGTACLMNNLLLANSLLIEGMERTWSDLYVAEEGNLSRNSYTLLSSSDEIKGWENSITSTFSGQMTDDAYTASVRDNGSYPILKRTLADYDIVCLPTTQRMCESAFLYDLNKDGTIGGVVTHDMLLRQRNVKSCIGALEFTGSDTDTSVESVSNTELLGDVSIYTLLGADVTSFKNLPSGVYIMTDGVSSKKIIMQ